MVGSQSLLGHRRGNMLSQDRHNVPMQDPINSSATLVGSQLPLGHRLGHMLSQDRHHVPMQDPINSSTTLLVSPLDRCQDNTS